VTVSHSRKVVVVRLSGFTTL